MERLIRNGSDAHLGRPCQEPAGRAERLGCKGANAAEHKRRGKEFRRFHVAIRVNQPCRRERSFSRVHIWLLRRFYQDLVAEQSEFGAPLHMDGFVFSEFDSRAVNVSNGAWK